MRTQNSKIKAQNSKQRKVGLITLVLAIMLLLLAEPILAAARGGGRGGGGAGGGGSGGSGNRGSQGSQSSSPSSAPKAQPESRGGASSSSGATSSTVTQSSGNRQPDRTVTSAPSTPTVAAPRPSSATSNPQPRSTDGSRSTAQEQPTTLNTTNSVRTSTTVSSITVEKPSVTQSSHREKTQINEDKTSRIGSSIGKNNSPAPVVEKQSSSAASGRSSSDRTVRISSSKNNDEGPSVSADSRTPAISQSKTSRIASPISKEKSSSRARGRRSSTDLNKSASDSEAGPKIGMVGTDVPSVSADDSFRQTKMEQGSNRLDSKRESRTDRPSADDKSPAREATRNSRPGGIRGDVSEKARESQDTRRNPQDSRQGPEQKDRGPAGSILSKRAAEHKEAVIDKFDGDKTRIRRNEHIGSSHVTYDDCPQLVRHNPRYEHIYFDSHRQVCHRTIWPDYYFSVYYNWGPCWTFRYVYPYYHRKYVFVSLGGYWPIEYTCVRYYWYGCHPYAWCGYYPIPYEVAGDTYNYYTYNYYTYNYPGTETTAATTAEPGQTTNYITPVNADTFADVREKLAAQQAGKPGQETPADVYFEEAVKAFEINDYATAIEKFAKAMEWAPDDMILPFAYAQALLANEQYVESAKVLRTALAKVSPEKEEVFYPRGLYADDEILFEQVDRLEEKARLYSFDADLQLLLGYQLLGIGELDNAVGPLRLAGQDLENAAAASVLLNVLEKVRANSTSQQNVD